MISPLVSLMVDQVCSLQARGICDAILIGNREQSAAGYRKASPKTSLDFSLLLLGVLLAIADGSRSFLSY